MPVEVVVADEIRALAKRTNKKNPKRDDVLALRTALRNTDLWQEAGKAAEHAIEKIIDLKSGGSVFVQESLREGVRRQRTELTEEADGPLERLLIEQVAVSWLALYTTQHTYDGMLTEKPTYRSLDYWERRLNGAHRRFVRACEALARVRKLAWRGPVQVNVAARGGTFQQINAS